jgi:hypothetical protein
MDAARWQADAPEGVRRHADRAVVVQDWDTSAPDYVAS